MSAQKNKLSADFEGREKKTPVVQRFFLPAEEPQEKTFDDDEGEDIFATPDKIQKSEKTTETETALAEIPQPETKPVPVVKPRYYLKNTIEDAVIDEVIAALKHMQGICKCEKCFYDMCAIALNSFPALYATSEQGELFGKANSILNIATRNKISSKVFAAIDKVKKTPLHKDPVYDNSVLIRILRHE